MVNVSVPKGGGYIQLGASQMRRLAPMWRRIAHLDPARSVLPERAVLRKTSIEVRRIEKEYIRADVTYYDGLLSTKALDRLRRFCMESCVWHQEKSVGYVGSQLDDGFATPLLFQIAEELAQTLPQVFRRHKLRHAWAYKYDSELQEGIDAHADQAAVNGPSFVGL